MNAIRPCLLALAISQLLAAPYAIANDDRIDRPAEVADRLDQAGFRSIVVQEFDGLLWHANAIDPSGQPVTVRLSPATGDIQTIAAPPVAVVVLPSLPLNEAGLVEVLAEAGYHDIHDIVFEDGRWRAEARDAIGEDFEIHVDADTARIVHLEND